MAHTSLASLFSDIANAIRAKTGSSSQIVADDFPTAIAAIPTGGGGGTVTITDTLDTHGGTIRTITTNPAATVIEALTATANAIYTPAAGHAYGPVTVNVAGAGGLVYETGTYTPNTTTSAPTISFANTHTKAPFFVAITETSTEAQVNPSAQNWFFYDNYQITGGGFVDGVGVVYAKGSYTYCNSEGTAGTYSISCTFNSDASGSSSSSYPRYFVTETGFRPMRNATTYGKFVAGHTYKWIAVWLS